MQILIQTKELKSYSQFPTLSQTSAYLEYFDNIKTDIFTHRLCKVQRRTSSKFLEKQQHLYTTLLRQEYASVQMFSHSRQLIFYA